MPIQLYLFCKQTMAMKTALFFLCFSLFLISCNSTDKQTANKSHNAATERKSLESFADSLVRLNKYGLESLDRAADYYQQLVPADTLLADSAAVMFLRHVGTVTDSANQKLFQDTTDYFDLVYNQSQAAPEAQKQFQQLLKNNHLILQGDGEGGVYAVPDYDWITKVITPKTSAATDRYLSLLAKEKQTPTLLDAGLAIEATELADRLVLAEELETEKLPFNFAEDVKRRHKFYLGTLLFGSDNSPALEYNEVVLTEQYAKGYKHLLTNYPTSNAAQLVGEWQEIVKSKKSQQVEIWQKKYNPYQ